MSKIKTHPDSVRQNRHLLNKRFSDECKGFILQLMAPNPEHRITCGEALRSSWASEPCNTPEDNTSVATEKRGGAQRDSSDGGESDAETETLLVSQLMQFRDFGQLKRAALLAMAFNSTSAGECVLCAALRPCILLFFRLFGKNERRRLAADRTMSGQDALVPSWVQ